MGRLCWVFFGLIFLGNAFGDGSGSHWKRERVLFSNLTAAHGLPSAEVRCFFQDRQGNYWIANEAGLAKFDGFELSTYEAGGSDGVRPVPVNVEAIAQDVDGRLWLGTNGNGLYRFEPGWGIRERLDVSDGLAHDSITGLETDREGTLWVGTRAGLHCIDRETMGVKRISIRGDGGLEEVLAIRLGGDGTLWAVLSGAGVYRKRSGEAWVRVWRMEVDRVQVALGPDGDFWVHLGRMGLLELGATGTEVRLHEIPPWVLEPEAQERGVSALAVDGFGDVWLGVEWGLLKYATAESHWTRHQHRRGAGDTLVEGAITCLFRDRRNLIWAGSGKGEISWHHPGRYWFPGFQAEPGGELYSNETNGFWSAGDGTVWVATGKGLNRFDPKSGALERVPVVAEGESPDWKEILCVMKDRMGRLWVGTRKHGLAMRKPGETTFRFYQHSPTEEGALPGNDISALYEDPTGAIWVAVLGRGLARYRPESGGGFQTFLPDEQEAELLFINDFEPDGNGGAWLATVGGGLWHLDPLDGRLRPSEEVLPLERDLPSDNVIDVLRAREGTLWVGTFGGGLVEIDAEAGTMETYRKENERLPDWSALGLVEDSQGKIWAATGSGLVQIDPREGGMRRFGIRDGLQSMAFRPRAVHRLSDGRLLFGTSEGFNLIDPGQLPAESPPPRPLLVGFELYGEPVKPSEEGWLLKKPLALTEELRIPFDPRMRFSLRYGTLNYADQGQVQFRFRMDPLEDKWQKGTGDRRASYQGLKPGKYQFAVQTSRDGQTWDGSVAAIRITILPPWYRTWWARFLGLSCLVSVGVFLGRFLYAKKQIEQKAEQERLENARNRAEAALAQQLQSSMLVEQTGADFRKGLNARAVFHTTLERLARHLGLSRCLIYWRPVGEGFGGGRILAEYAGEGTEGEGTEGEGTEGEGTEANPEQRGWAEEELLEIVFRKEGAVCFTRGQPPEDSAALAQWRKWWGRGVKSVLAVRTLYQEQANGMLVLQDCREPRDWSEDERRLAESVAGQLGLILAQFELSERESRYLRELEQARIEADEANRAKGEFLANMTHELRTPLNAIIGFSEILEKEGKIKPEQQESLDIIHSSAEHLLGVINDVLEISKLEAGKTEVHLEEVDFPKMLKSVHGMLSANAAKKGLRFELIPLNELPETVEVDKNKVRQILINLLGNAIKFTGEGGVSLRVSAHSAGEADEEGEEEPVAGMRRVLLTLEVLDTGPGIPEHELGKLFGKFVQTQTGKRAQEGSGLGLAIARGFTELLGGTIEVVSRENVGTLFTIRLPVRERIREAEGTDQQRDGGGAGNIVPAGHLAAVPPGLRVLVAEDQEVNRLLLKKVLRKAGCILEEAEDGKVAVEKSRTFQPDIIIMDEGMPEMMGTEATRKILEEAGEDAPVIISLTAFAMAEQREAALAAGCKDFLAKPFKQDDLYALLARYRKREGTRRAA